MIMDFFCCWLLCGLGFFCGWGGEFFCGFFCVWVFWGEVLLLLLLVVVVGGAVVCWFCFVLFLYQALLSLFVADEGFLE